MSKLTVKDITLFLQGAKEYLEEALKDVPTYEDLINKKDADLHKCGLESRLWQVNNILEYIKSN